MRQDDPLSAARELFAQGNHRQALASCRTMLEWDPLDLEARLLCARALLALRRDEEARVELAGALRRSPRLGEAYSLLAELALRRDELYAAEIFAAEAIRLGGGDHPTDLLEVARSLRCRVRPTVSTTMSAAEAEERNPASAAAAAMTPATSAAADAIPRRPGGAVTGAPLGECLVASGAITRRQLFEALRAAEAMPERLGDVVVRLGFSPRAQVERVAASRGPRAQILSA